MSAQVKDEVVGLPGIQDVSAVRRESETEASIAIPHKVFQTHLRRIILLLQKTVLNLSGFMSTTSS